ncbi:hypothetical protein ACFL5X_02490 [Candidatus Omnitrophota bacterium]
MISQMSAPFSGITSLSHKRKDVLVVLFVLLIVAFFYSPLFQNLTLGFSSVDWYEKYCFTASLRKSVLEYHQFPLRSPFIGGGYPTIGHPYDESLNPFAVVSLVFGEVIGIKVIIFSIFIISALGMLYLTRYVLGYNRLGSFFSTMTFILSSWGGCQITEGNYEKLYLYFFPWLFAFFIKSRKDRRFIICSSLFLSLLVIKGIISLPAILFLFLFACLHSIERRGGKLKVDVSYVVIFFIVVGLSFALCAPKILSAIQLLGQRIGFVHFPFEDSYSDISHYASVTTERALNLKRLYATLLLKQGYMVDGDDFFQMYLGYIPLTLFLVSSLIYWKRVFKLLILLTIFVIISFGSNSPIDLFGLLWRSNPFVRYIWKLDVAFSMYIFFIISLIAGRVFLLLGRVQKYRVFSACLAVLISFISINNMFWPNRRFLKNQFSQEIPCYTSEESFFQVQLRDPEKTKDEYFYLLQNVGVTNYRQDVLIRIGSYAVERYSVDRGDYRHIASARGRLKLNPDYRGEAFFLDPANKAQIQKFSPNKIGIKAVVKKPDILVINQNYHKGWHASAGEISQHRGLLAVSLKEQGAYDLDLTYVPFEFYAGLFISLLTMAGIVLFSFFRKR